MSAVPIVTAAQERVIIDARLIVAAGASEGHCLDLPAGLLAISLQADPLSDFARREWSGPVRFSFDGGYRWIDPDAALEAAISTTATTSTIALLGGSLYCYRVANRTSAPSDAGLADLSNLRRTVSLRMTFSPAP
jgi:hypothetical protein